MKPSRTGQKIWAVQSEFSRTRGLVFGAGPELHGITVAQAQTLMEQGGTLDLEDGVLVCQVINNQLTVARFNANQYAKAKELMDAKGLHVMDALKRDTGSHRGLP